MIYKNGVQQFNADNITSGTLVKARLGAHEDTHVSGGSDDIDSALVVGAIPNLDTSKITTGQLALARLVDAVCSETEADGKVSDHAGVSDAHHIPTSLGGAALVVARFNTTRGLPATGTFTLPERLNDTLTAQPTGGNAVDLYAEVLLEGAFWINQFRQFGEVGHTGDGRWKIQTLNPATLAWEDWLTDIPVRTTSDWGNWTAGALRLVCGVRLVITTLDTMGDNYIYELECQYA